MCYPFEKAPQGVNGRCGGDVAHGTSSLASGPGVDLVSFRRVGEVNPRSTTRIVTP
jgi:hypothetical protein